jgi:small subunit ribosomal protein S5|tara:strand:+ start:2314 stop:2841 length:528 start_codon:yes stop_codon:yes gene_type:complete
VTKRSISRIDATELVLNEKLIYINRVSKVVKGGKRLSFSALMVVGDGSGHVGVGVGKANEVPLAISKAGTIAKKNLVKVYLANNTIPHEVMVKLGAAKVLMRPASPGTGLIAGGSVRAVVEAVGIKDILTKSLGSSNKVNVAKATVFGLSQLRNPKAELARRRGNIKGQEAIVDG